MRSALRWTSIVVFAALGAFLVWFGLTYASVEDMLWFHAAAAPASAHDAIRPLYLALMNLIGGSSAGLGALSIYVALGPLRGGAAWAATALAAVLLTVFAVAGYTAEELAAATGAPTSWRLMGVLGAAALGAYLAHLGSRSRSR